jgi:hypothetical protein
MSKKDFKGMTRSILSSNVKSLTDFLEPSNEGTQATPPQEKRAPHNEDTPTPSIAEHSKPQPSQIKTQNTQDSPEPIEVTETPPVLSEATDPEKTRISLNLSTRITYKLEDLKTAMRKMAPRRDLSKISKSSIVEAAVDVVAEDLAEKGLNSLFAKMILNK